jgi:hypothetical protein
MSWLELENNVKLTKTLPNNLFFQCHLRTLPSKAAPIVEEKSGFSFFKAYAITSLFLAQAFKT